MDNPYFKYTEDDSTKIRHDVVREGAVVTAGERDIPISEREFGLCATCTKLTTIKTKYDRIFVSCQWYDKPDNFNVRRYDPPVACAGYWYKGWKDVKTLIPMAMDISEMLAKIHKQKIGF